MGLISDIAGPVLGFASGFFDRSSQKKENQKQRNQEYFMWNAQNEYNTPARQMERLKAGGLNPNLVYGNGSIANTASSPNVSQARELPRMAPVVQGTVSQIADLRQKRYQNDLLEQQVKTQAQLQAESAMRTWKGYFADAQKTFADIEHVYADKNRVEQETSNLKTVGARQKVGYLKDSLDYQSAVELQRTMIEQAKANLIKTGAETSNIDSHTQETKIGNKSLAERNQGIIDEIKQRISASKKTMSAQDVQIMLDEMKAQLRTQGVEVTDNVLSRLYNQATNMATDPKEDNANRQTFRNTLHNYYKNKR